ncbi:MAG: PDZ domain-containing protein [Gemmatimonadota bacterium]
MKARRRIQRWLSLTLGVGLLVSGAGRPARAQEASARRAPEPRARIGVFLEESCSVEGPCRTPLTVQSVVPGGPAEKAGIRTGDELLEIDGLSFETARGRRRLGELVDGQSVALTVQRGGARLSIQVVPTADLRWSAARLLGRPPSAVRIRGMAPRPLPQGPVSLSTKELDSLRVVVKSLGDRRTGFVLVHGDSTGAVRVEVSDPTVSTDGSLSYSYKVQSGEPSVPTAEEEAGAVAGLFGYLWADSAFAGRLRVARDSLAEQARAELDSLLRLRSRLRLDAERLETLTRRLVESGSPSRGRGGSRLVRAPEGRYIVRSLVENDRRVAGAEFQPLSREMASYFDGVKDGLLVLRVLPGTPAARLGLREGDVVVEAGGRPCDSVRQLRDILHGRAGVNVKWIRKGRTREGTIEGS